MTEARMRSNGIPLEFVLIIHQTMELFPIARVLQ